MALRHCHPASSNVLHSSTKLCARGEISCPSGLKVGALFDDVDNRIFRSTYRATHYFIASIPRVSPPFNGRAHLLPEAERPVHSGKDIDAPEFSVLLPEDVQQDSLGRVYFNAQTSNGCIDCQPDLEECDGFNSDKMLMKSQPRTSPGKSLTNVHATALSIKIPTTSGLHNSYLDIQKSYRVSEFCVEHPEAPTTPDLQPELKVWDCEGLHIGNVEGHFGAVSKVCNNDYDGDILILEENELMPPCKSTCLNARQSEVVGTGYNSRIGPLYTSFDCQEGANSNHNLQRLNFKSRKWSRVVFDYLDKLSLDICETTFRQKLLFQALPTSKLFLTLQKLVRFLKKGKSDEDAALLGEQLIILLHIYAHFYKPRRTSAQGRRSRAASSFGLVVKNAQARRDGWSKMVDMKILVQHCQKCYMRGRRNVSPKHLLVEQAGQCDSMPSLSIDTDSVCRDSYLWEDGDEGFPMCTVSSSELLDGFQGLSMLSQGSLEQKDTFKSSQIVSVERNSGSASKLFNLLEIGHGVSTNLIEESPEKMDEPKEGLKKSRGLNLSESANSSMDSLVEEGSQRFVVHVDDNDDSVSSLPIARPHSDTTSQCIASSSSYTTEKELGIFMPYTRVNERHSRERLEHFAEGFLLRRHILHQQQKAELAPPFPPRDSAGYACNFQGARGKPFGEVKTNPYTLCSTKARTENGIDPGMNPTFSAKPQDVAVSIGDHGCLVGADVVIDIVGLMNYIESQCSQVERFTDVPTNPTNYTGMPLIGGHMVISNFNAVIVTIIAFVVYTKTLLEGGLVRVGARTQKEESD